ncbi:hypothetical protein CH263_19935 [Rhodococcus sp. 06-1059B-a]|nr:hypothetical protein CH263_19935 [Rhodococcus sp. 06-1059B-a]
MIDLRSMSVVMVGNKVRSRVPLQSVVTSKSGPRARGRTGIGQSVRAKDSQRKPCVTVEY